MPVLRIMQTNVCVNDCYYCAFRSGRDVRRESFTPDELAGLTDRMARAGLIRGLFLSSGVVGSADGCMERMAATAEILRRRHGFRGYIHLKIMPGASSAAVVGAMRLADRVSINLEAPTEPHLQRLTSTKGLESDLMTPLRHALAADRAEVALRASRATQYVVGAAGESDLDILRRSEQLYRDLKVSRAYYSTFNPVPGTPLEGRPAEDPLREHRLYQADFLLRKYSFSVDDLPVDARGDLPRALDPKLAWAEKHPEAFPVDLARAGRRQLLTVPGVGPKSADAVLAARRVAVLRGESDLRALGIDGRRAARWVTIAGRRLPTQLPLPLAGEGAGRAGH
jgi:predicted DNA-binding helix-hairpin-helix protein